MTLQLTNTAEGVVSPGSFLFPPHLVASCPHALGNRGAWLDQDAERQAVTGRFCFGLMAFVVYVFFVDELNSCPEQFSKSELTVCVLLARVPEMSLRGILTTRVVVVLRGHAGDSLQQTHRNIFCSVSLLILRRSITCPRRARARAPLSIEHTPAWRAC